MGKYFLVIDGLWLLQILFYFDLAEHTHTLPRVYISVHVPVIDLEHVTRKNSVFLSLIKPVLLLIMSEYPESSALC